MDVAGLWPAPRKEWSGPPGRVAPRREVLVKYEKPMLRDFGSIADHTFDTPGKGDKGVCGNDPMWNEPSCPSP